MNSFDWDNLISRIRSRKCTPFLGAGASAGYVLPSRAMAKKCAVDCAYPFLDKHDLARVTHYMAMRKRERNIVKQRLVEQHFERVVQPDFSRRDEPHALMADLQLPVYLTTNYDDFMCAALEHRQRRPLRQICPWYAQRDGDQQDIAARQAEDVETYPTRPVVYHLHGHFSEPNSLVLTEDDYIDFLVRIARDSKGQGKLLPPTIEGAIFGQSLLFIGYSLNDWTLRVLLRGLLAPIPPGQGYRHVSVQLPPSVRRASEEALNEVQNHLGNYYSDMMRIDVFWGDAREFCATLRDKWEASRGR